MKRLLLTIILSSPFLIGAASSVYEAADQFMKGEKKHKNECFEFEKNFMTAKFDLMKKQHDEMFDLKIEGLHKLGTQGFSEASFKECLSKKVALCERHLEQWKALCNAHHELGEKLYTHSKTMLDSFKEQYMNGDKGGYYRAYESTARTEPNFLEKAMDLFKGKLD